MGSPRLNTYQKACREMRGFYVLMWEECISKAVALMPRMERMGKSLAQACSLCRQTTELYDRQMTIFLSDGVITKDEANVLRTITHRGVGLIYERVETVNRETGEVHQCLIVISERVEKSVLGSTKKCSKCQREKTLNEFPIEEAKADKRGNYCVPCKSIDNYERRHPLQQAADGARGDIARKDGAA